MNYKIVQYGNNLFIETNDFYYSFYGTDNDYKKFILKINPLYDNIRKYKKEIKYSYSSLIIDIEIILLKEEKRYNSNYRHITTLKEILSSIKYKIMIYNKLKNYINDI